MLYFVYIRNRSYMLFLFYSVDQVKVLTSDRMSGAKKRKGLSIDEKKKVILGIYHERYRL